MPAAEKGGGVIVNIADLAALETWPAYVPHGITKAGIIQMTRGLAHALAPRIRVNAIAPGAVLLPEHWNATDAAHLVASTPLGRLGSPNDVVGAVDYLISADYVTGVTIVVDGGRRVRT
jgi:pteridine reductase